MPLLDRDFLTRLERLAIVSRKLFAGHMKGERRSKRRGVSSEFADYRNYVPGDDIRFLDWNIFGRLDQLFLKLFEEEEDLRVHLLLDTSMSMAFGEPGKLEHARRLAAAIGYIGLVNMDRVRVHALGRAGGGASSPAWRGKRQAPHLFAFCEQLVGGGSLSLNRSLRDFAVQYGAGKGVAVIISDFLDPDGYEDGLKYLLGKSMDIHVIHLLSPEELAPTLAGDLRLVDSESGAPAEISISSPLLRQYHARLEQFQENLRTHCHARGIAYSFASTAIPFDTIALDSLRRGGLLR